jgi:hypothetical protein
LWKALSTVLGDPSADKDYQRRYKKLGFDDTFFLQKVEHVRKLRNEYDVAHYTVESEKQNRVDSDYLEAKKIVETALRAYRERLLAGGKPFLAARRRK